MFEVKKGVPIPPRGSGDGQQPIYPFATMEVGDCFEAPDDKGRGGRGESNRQIIIANCARGYAKRNNPDAKFRTRKIGDVIRCWRIA